MGWGWACGDSGEAYTEGYHPNEEDGKHVDLDVLDPVPEDRPDIPLPVPSLHERVALAPQSPELLPEVEAATAGRGVHRAVGARPRAAEVVHRPGESDPLARGSVGWERA